MIKAILLVIEPVMTWERIALNQKSLRQMLLLFLVPLLLLSVSCEVAGLVHWGRNHELGQTVKMPLEKAALYGACEFLLSLAVVFIGAKTMKSIGDTFHTRHTYGQCFMVVAYTLSPLFLVRVLDAYPGMNAWASFGIGMALSAGTLYHGVPRVLQPDPPNAFGLYLSSALILTGVAGLAQFLALLVLEGKIKVF
jgi:hypothetical protein